MFKVTQLVTGNTENLTQRMPVLQIIDRLTEGSLSLILETTIKECSS